MNQEKNKPARHFGIAARLWLSMLVILLMFVVLGLYGNKSLDNVSQTTTEIYTHPFAMNNAVRDIQYHVTAMHRSMKDIVLTTSIDDIKQIIVKVKQHEADALDAFDLISELSLENKLLIEDARSVLFGWRPIRSQIIDFVTDNKRDQAIHITLNQSAQYVLLIEESMDLMLLRAKIEINRLTKSSLLQIANSIQIYWVFVGIVSLAIMLLGYLLIRSIVPPIDRLAQYLRQLAVGDINFTIVDIQRGDEIGLIAQSVESLQKSTHFLSQQTQEISYGNLESEIKIRSEEDVLGKSVSTMLKNLKDVAYINEGNRNLDVLMRGNCSLEELSQNIITYLCQYTDTKIACFYVVKQGIVYRTGSYACSNTDSINKFKVGQGIVGEAALQQSPVLLSDLPKDYLKVGTATGEVSVNHVFVVPIFYNQEVIALIEFGLFDLLSDIQTEFIKSVDNAIGTMVSTAVAREREQALLDAMVAS